MRKYIPLTPQQIAVIDKLGFFFDPTTAITSDDKKDKLPEGYTRATDLLTSQQKNTIDTHEEKVQKGFEKYSAY